MPELPADAYDRGHLAGEIAARLAQHDQHFHDINGQIKHLIVETHDLVLAVQRLADQAIADAKTRISTAEAVERARKEAADALESERKARRERAEVTWSPLARLFAVLGAVAAVVAMILGVKAIAGR